MINTKNCIIELNVNSFRHFVYDNNKIKAVERKGETSQGKKIHYFDIYCKDKKGVYFSAYTPTEILNSFGTYQIIYE